MLHIERKKDEDKDGVASDLYADEINEIVDNLNSYIELFLNYGEKSRTEQIAYATATFNSDITYIGIFSDNQSKITLTNTTSHKLQRYLPRFSGTFIPNDNNSGKTYIRVGNLEYVELTHSDGSSLSANEIKKHHLYGFSFDIALNKMVIIPAGITDDSVLGLIKANIDLTKYALKNGDKDEYFKVKYPKDDDDATSKEYVDKLVERSKVNIDYEKIDNEWKVVDGNDKPIPIAYEHGNKENTFQVDDPDDDYDATNKKYVDDLVDKYKVNIDYEYIDGKWQVVDGKDKPIPIAYKNGSSDNIFRVANPKDDSDAVNKEYLEDVINNLDISGGVQYVDREINGKKYKKLVSEDNQWVDVVYVEPDWDLVNKDNTIVSGCIKGNVITVSNAKEFREACLFANDKTFYGDYIIRLKSGIYDLGTDIIPLINIAMANGEFIIESESKYVKPTLRVKSRAGQETMFDISNTKVTFKNIYFLGEVSTQQIVAVYDAYKSIVTFLHCKFDIAQLGIMLKAWVFVYDGYIKFRPQRDYMKRRWWYDIKDRGDYEYVMGYTGLAGMGNNTILELNQCVLEGNQGISPLKQHDTHFDRILALCNCEFKNFGRGLQLSNIDFHYAGELKFDGVADAVIQAYYNVNIYASEETYHSKITVKNTLGVDEKTYGLNIRQSNIKMGLITFDTKKKRDIRITDTTGYIYKIESFNNGNRIYTTVTPEYIRYKDVKEYDPLTFLGYKNTYHRIYITCDNEDNPEEYINLYFKNVTGYLRLVGKRGMMYFYKGEPSYIKKSSTHIVTANIAKDTITLSGFWTT
jgi:hypothetical protein